MGAADMRDGVPAADGTRSGEVIAAREGISRSDVGKGAGENPGDEKHSKGQGTVYETGHAERSTTQEVSIEGIGEEGMEITSAQEGMGGEGISGGGMTAEGGAGGGMVGGGSEGGAIERGGIAARRKEGGGMEGEGNGEGESATSLLLSRLRSLEEQIKALRQNDKFRTIFDMSIVSAAADVAQVSTRPRGALPRGSSPPPLPPLLHPHCFCGID